MIKKLRPLIAGNWKMNGLSTSLNELQELNRVLLASDHRMCDVLICLPATLLSRAGEVCANGPVELGGQDCHTERSGAHTGDISAAMLADAGARYVIVGHSERRADHGETSELVRNKAQAVLENALVPIVCVGETKDQKLDGQALAIVGQQVEDSVPDLDPDQELVIAYEPVWAIGTGLVPSCEDIVTMHTAIRGWLTDRFCEKGARIRILYGGSLKASNAAQILPLDHVNGGLIGGASLKAESLLDIINAL